MDTLFLACLYMTFGLVVAFFGSLFAIAADRPRLAVALALPPGVAYVVMWLVFMTIAVTTGYQG